jgi:methyl-accepting chemotaxis protein
MAQGEDTPTFAGASALSRLRNLPIGVRLALAFGAVCLACVAVAVAGYRGATTLKSDTEVVSGDARGYELLGNVAEANALTADAVARHLYVVDGALRDQDAVAREIEQRLPKARGALEEIKRIHPDDVATIDDVLRRFDAFAAAAKKAVELSRAETVDGVEDRAGSRTRYLEEVRPAAEALGARIRELNAKMTRDLREARADADATASSTGRTVVIVAVLAVLLSIGLAALITRTVTRPVKVIVDRLATLRDHCVADLAAGVRALADGDLTHSIEPVTPPIDDDAKDELGEVARSVDAIRGRLIESVGSYNDATATLRELVGSLADSAGVLAAASQQMASSSEEAGRAVSEIAHAVGDVAQGAERQVRSVEQARQATEEVGEATRSSADSARQTAEAAEHAREVAREGEQAVDQATDAMRAVRESSVQVTAAMQQLAAKSEQIGGIVETITGISEQTNLLALNAAIEAARAGEQGRGFAVVAEEVRKLAEESQEAAASIAALVEEIQGETAQAVAVVEDGAARSDEGAATVEQARDAFARIGASVDDMTARVEAIAAAVQQIAAGAERVEHDMSEVAAVAEQSSASTEQVSASTQETSASTQEIASSAQQLAGTAAELERLVGRFTLTR